MTRDEVAGLTSSAPAQAPSQEFETVEPDNGEGEAVDTVVRDVLDKADNDTSAPEGAGATPAPRTSEPGSVAREVLARSPADPGTDPAEPGLDAAVAEDMPNPSAGEGITVVTVVEQVPAGVAPLMGEATPDQAVLDEAVPDEAVPDEAVPDEAVPDEAVPDEAVPDEAVPDEAVSDEAVPDEAEPADWAAPTGHAAAEYTQVVASVPAPRPVPRPRPRPALETQAVYEEVAPTYVVQDAPAELSPSELRVDFGAHLEANYQRLVAQMYAITLSPDQAHSAVQDAYSRAWRNWSLIGRSADPTGWVRRVAVRTTMRSWRHVLARFGLFRSTPPVAEGLDERTTALLNALRELPPPERRSVVLFHMAGLSHGEIAAVEQVSPSTIGTRLDRARRVVLGDDSDLLTGVIELPGDVLDDDHGFVGAMSVPPDVRADPAGHLDDRWERADTWNGGPDGSWMVAEAPPWDTPNFDEWPRASDDRWTGKPRSSDPQARSDAPTAIGDNDSAGVDDKPSWGTTADGSPDAGIAQPWMVGSDEPAAGGTPGGGALARAEGALVDTEDKPRNDSEDKR